MIEQKNHSVSYKKDKKKTAIAVFFVERILKLIDQYIHITNIGC